MDSLNLQAASRRPTMKHTRMRIRLPWKESKVEEEKKSILGLKEIFILTFMEIDVTKYYKTARSVMQCSSTPLQTATTKIKTVLKGFIKIFFILFVKTKCFDTFIVLCHLIVYVGII